jgi:hypothetical protein
LENTQINDWRCNVFDVSPGGGTITLPGRPVVFRNGGAFICRFDSLENALELSVRMIINFEDGTQLASLSKNNLVHFDARGFCPKWLARDSMAPDAPPPDAWKTCALNQLTFIGQKVTNKTE